MSPCYSLSEIRFDYCVQYTLHRGAATREIRFGEVPLKYSASSVPLVALMRKIETVHLSRVDAPRCRTAAYIAEIWDLFLMNCVLGHSFEL